MCCTKCLSNTDMYSCVKGVTEAYCDAKHTLNWDMYRAIWIHSQTHSDKSFISPPKTDRHHLPNGVDGLIKSWRGLIFLDV